MLQTGKFITYNQQTKAGELYWYFDWPNRIPAYNYTQANNQQTRPIKEYPSHACLSCKYKL